MILLILLILGKGSVVKDKNGTGLLAWDEIEAIVENQDTKVWEMEMSRIYL